MTDKNPFVERLRAMSWISEEGAEEIGRCVQEHGETMTRYESFCGQLDGGVWIQSGVPTKKVEMGEYGDLPSDPEELIQLIRGTVEEIKAAGFSEVGVYIVGEEKYDEPYAVLSFEGRGSLTDEHKALIDDRLAKTEAVKQAVDKLKYEELKRRFEKERGSEG